MKLLRPASRLSILAVALGAACAGSVHAQSLVELYDSARAFDATYQSARAQYDANLYRAEQAKAGLLPSANLSAGVTKANTDTTIGSASSERSTRSENINLNATQPLYRPANAYTFDQSKKQVELAQGQLVAAEHDLQVRVSQAYFDVLAAEDTLAFVRANKAATAEQLASAKRNFEVGTSTVTDSREAQARFDLGIAQEIAAENDLRVKKSALDQLVGRQGTSPKPLLVPVVLPALLPNDVTNWVQQSEDNNPAIRQTRAALEIARLETKKAETGHHPTLDLNAGYSINRNPNGTVSTGTASQRSNSASIGLAFNLPLFAGFATQNRIKETLSLEEKAQADFDASKRAVAQATRTAFFGVQSGLGQVKALEAAEASSQSALDANKLGYQVGVRINIDVLNSQSQLFQTKRDLARARYDVLVNSLKLRQAAGTLKVEDLQGVNALLAK